jgi:hypothetical protein
MIGGPNEHLSAFGGGRSRPRGATGPKAGSYSTAAIIRCSSAFRADTDLINWSKRYPDELDYCSATEIKLGEKGGADGV